MGSYYAGTAVFTGKVLSPQAAVPITAPVTTTQMTLYLFPGKCTNKFELILMSMGKYLVIIVVYFVWYIYSDHLFH